MMYWTQANWTASVLNQVQNAIRKVYSLFFCFFLSRGGSFRALMMREAADGTTEIVA